MTVDAVLNMSNPTPLDENFRKFLELEEMLKKDNDESRYQLEINNKELERNQQTIAELTEKLTQLKEQNFELETELEIEELKQKTCSDETQKAFDTLMADLENKRKEYTLKQDYFKQTFQTELNLNKEKKVLRVKFLASNQEILIKYINAQLFRASYEAKSEALNEPAKLQEFDNIIKKFNDLAGTKQNLKDLFSKLRELFN